MVSFFILPLGAYIFEFYTHSFNLSAFPLESLRHKKEVKSRAVKVKLTALSSTTEIKFFVVTERVKYQKKVLLGTGTKVPDTGTDIGSNVNGTQPWRQIITSLLSHDE